MCHKYRDYHIAAVIPPLLSSRHFTRSNIINVAPSPKICLTLLNMKYSLSSESELPIIGTHPGICGGSMSGTAPLVSWESAWRYPRHGTGGGTASPAFNDIGIGCAGEKESGGSGPGRGRLGTSWPAPGPSAWLGVRAGIGGWASASLELGRIEKAGRRGAGGTGATLLHEGVASWVHLTRQEGHFGKRAGNAFTMILSSGIIGQFVLVRQSER